MPEYEDAELDSGKEAYLSTDTAANILMNPYWDTGISGVQYTEKDAEYRVFVPWHRVLRIRQKLELADDDD